MHVDALVGGVEVDEEGLDVGDEDLFVGRGEDGEERGGVGEAAGAVGGHGEVYRGDGADGIGAAWLDVVDDAADEVGDVGGVVVELDAFGGGDEDVEAREGFGFFDGVDGVEGEDNAAVIAADGEPVAGDGGGAGFGGRGGVVGRGEEEAGTLLEALREVREELGEDLSFAALGAEEVGEGGPLGHVDSIRG